MGTGEPRTYITKSGKRWQVIHHGEVTAQQNTVEEIVSSYRWSGGKDKDPWVYMGGISGEDTFVRLSEMQMEGVGGFGDHVGVGRDVMERLLPAKQVKKIRKLSDEQTGELAVQVYLELIRRIEEALGREGQEALNRLMLKSNFMKDDTGLTRNNIFKAAHALGIELPSHMF